MVDMLAAGARARGRPAKFSYRKESVRMPQLPKVPFGDTYITRLISGGNPLVGNSHFTPELSREMAEYFSAEEVVKYFHRLVENGIDTLQARGDYRVLQWLELFKREGGKLQWIVQTVSEMHDVFENIRVLAATRPIGIYHHGSQTDKWWIEGTIDKVKDYLKCIRDQGVQVGLGTHTPEVIEYAEEHDWDVDFYMACFYNLNRKPRESAVISGRHDDTEVYPDEDPVRMSEVIRATEKTCLAFKVLAAGRRCQTQEDVRAAFTFAFANIKPKDAVVVGMFDKHADQIPLNVAHALAALRAQEAAAST